LVAVRYPKAFSEETSCNMRTFLTLRSTLFWDFTQCRFTSVRNYQTTLVKSQRVQISLHRGGRNLKSRITDLLETLVTGSTFRCNAPGFAWGDYFWKVPWFRPFFLLLRATCRWRWVWSFHGIMLTGEH
jgi:hypothetical protein